MEGFSNPLALAGGCGTERKADDAFPVEPLFAGMLEKRKPGTPWKQRYCLHLGVVLLYYKPDDYVAHSPAGVISLSGATVSANGAQICIVECATKGGMLFELRAKSAADSEAWVAALTRSTRCSYARMPGASKGDALPLKKLQKDLAWDDVTMAAVEKVFEGSNVVTGQFMAECIALGTTVSGKKEATTAASIYHKKIVSGMHGKVQKKANRQEQQFLNSLKVSSEADAVTVEIDQHGSTGIIFAAATPAGPTYVKSVEKSRSQKMGEEITPGMRLIAVSSIDENGQSWTRSISGLDFPDTIALVSEADRPLQLTFVDDLESVDSLELEDHVAKSMGSVDKDVANTANSVRADLAAQVPSLPSLLR